MSRNAIVVENLGTAGPYSHAVDTGTTVYLSGQTGIDHTTGQMPPEIATQTRQCFANLFKILKAKGLTPDDVQKVNVYMTDISEFAAMNEVYAAQFKEPFPARTTVGVASLPGGAKVEIEMIALKK